MSKAQRIRATNARERIAAQQAVARRAEARKRMYLASGSVLGVIAIVLGLIIWKSASSNTAVAVTGTKATAAEASLVTKQLTTVPASTLDAVGKGSSAPLKPTSGQPALASGGKPEILYMGAEYCPYCAAERWAMVVALSRFGTFSNLGLIHSDAKDVYPNTPTLTFHGSSYTSKYVTLTPVEIYGLKNNGVILQKPTAAETALMTKYDPGSAGQGSPFPFVDIGNQYLAIGAQYLPSSLAKLTWAQVAAAIRDPNSAVAKGVDGAANSITAAICKVTKNAPAAVCNSAGTKAAAGSL
jgi:thiol-disulfide isomerase/thioredoxin